MNFQEKLALINTRFDQETITRRTGSIPEIARYYAVNRYAYRLFHNRSGFIHMGISRDGIYSEDDLFEQARYVASHIKALQARVVLELAYGQGANSIFLSKLFPVTKFLGIDLANGQADQVKHANLSLVHGDYHDLSLFAEASIDIVFVVEALCHSTQKEVVLGEVYRVLKPGGLFIVIDAYRSKSAHELTQDEITAIALVERGMMVARFEEYSEFKQTIKRCGFVTVAEEDVTSFIVPTLRRFEAQALRYFKRGWLMRVVNSCLPQEFTGNAISALLMPDMVERKIATYTMLTLKKSSE